MPTIDIVVSDLIDQIERGWRALISNWLTADNVLAGLVALWAGICSAYDEALRSVSLMPPVIVAITGIAAVVFVLSLFGFVMFGLRTPASSNAGSSRDNTKSVSEQSVNDVDVAAIPKLADASGAGSSGAQFVGIHIKTLIGTVVFPTSHDVGRMGDNLSAIYYTRRRYEKWKSKVNQVHGIDGVYVRSNPRNACHWEVVVVENKINTSRYKPYQLSVSGLRSQCEKMLMTMNREVKETAEIVLRALSGEDGFQLLRFVVRHDLRVGVSVRFCVDAEGNALQRHGKWNNEETMKRVLWNAVNKKRVQLLGEADSV
jgi:hypothetical protein